MKHKVFSVSNFKALDEPQGIFEAIVAVFNNIDRMGDKIIPGAFKKSLAAWEKSGKPIPVIFSHDWGNLDAHIGQVIEAKETEEGLYVKGQLDMEEGFAQRVWKKMKQGTLSQFSFAYDIVEAAVVTIDGKMVNELRELALLEVGPCLVGMNPETELLGVKAAFASHDSETSEGAWDGPANEKNVRVDEADSYYKQIYAWKDPDGEAGKKGTYSFIHHEVDAEGEPGSANMKACASAIGIMNGGRGVDVAATVWAKDRAGIHKHLAAHMMDAEMEAPELMPMSEMMGKEEKAFTDEEVRQLKAFLQMVRDGIDVKAGRRNSNADEDRMKRISELMEEISSLMRELLSDEGKDAGGDEGDDGGDKSDHRPREKPSVLAARVACELIEAGIE